MDKIKIYFKNFRPPSKCGKKFLKKNGKVERDANLVE